MTFRNKMILRMTKTPSLLLLLLIVLLGIGVRLIFLDRPMRLDESNTFISYVSQPLDYALSNYDRPNNHLLNTGLMYIAYKLFGNYPPVLRLPAFLAGVLLIPAVYFTGKKLYDDRTGLIAAALTSVWMTLIDYSVNGRGYTLQALFFILLIGLGRYLILSKNNKYLWGVFALLSALGFYAIPTMFYGMGIISLWMIAMIWRTYQGQERIRYLWYLFGALGFGAVITILLYLPPILNTGLDTMLGNRFISGDSPETGYLTFKNIPWMVKDIIFVGTPHLLLALFLVLSLWVDKKKNQIPISVIAGAWIVFMLVITPNIPPRRTWVFLIPLVAIWVAAGIDYLWSLTGRYVMPVVVVLLIGFMLQQSIELLPLSPETGRSDDSEAVALYLMETLQPEDRLMANPVVAITVEYYFIYYGYTDYPRIRRIPNSQFLRSSQGKRVWAIVQTSREFDEQFPNLVDMELDLSLIEKFAGIEIFEVTYEANP